MKMCWLGDASPKGLDAKLKAAGWTTTSDPPDAVVMHSAKPRKVPVCPAPRWLWLTGTAVEPALAQAAVLAGAYDVVALDSPGATAKILARLAEIAVPELVPALPSTAVAVGVGARRMLEKLARAARTSMPVLITGETGTGKEIAARLVHTWSTRKSRPFVPINCAAIPNELMEGELFGYTKGAFSGAVRSYDGALMAAEGGSVFLDEVDDTPVPTQLKLLRVLEDRVVNRLGETTPHEVNFRILAATNRDLKELVKQGSFGADFYQRLAIVSIHLPPLRERLEDIPVLVPFFIERFAREEPDAQKRPRVAGVSPSVLRAFAAYPWPGNIRELRNVIFEALVYKRTGDELLLSDLPRRVLEAPRSGPEVDPARIRQSMLAGEFNLKRECEELERRALATALELSGGSATRAARLLGEVGRGSSADPGGTVRAMVKRLGLSD